MYPPHSLYLVVETEVQSACLVRQVRRQESKCSKLIAHVLVVSNVNVRDGMVAYPIIYRDSYKSSGSVGNHRREEPSSGARVEGTAMD